jgi:hypothetical protein
VPKLVSRIKCKACGGTGRSSRGKECYPCQSKGVLLVKRGGRDAAQR